MQLAADFGARGQLSLHLEGGGPAGDERGFVGQHLAVIVDQDGVLFAPDSSIEFIERKA